jgi:hypothetical protein
VTRLNSHKPRLRHVDRVRRAARVRLGLRSLHNNSWAGDGTWDTQNPKGDELLLRHMRLGVRRRPERVGAQDDRLAQAAGRLRAPAGSWAAPCIGGVYAIKRARLAQGQCARDSAKALQPRAGAGRRVRFSKKWHTVFGRQYRVIKTQANKAKRVGLVTAKVLPQIH